MAGTAGRNTTKRPLSAAILGRRIKLLRLIRDMQQQELATAAGVSVTHLCKIEAGRHYPHRTTLELIATSLGTTAAALENS